MLPATGPCCGGISGCSGCIGGGTAPGIWAPVAGGPIGGGAPAAGGGGRDGCCMGGIPGAGRPPAGIICGGAPAAGGDIAIGTGC